jgi:hypothetical protein
MTDQYKPAEVNELGMATDMILGEKPMLAPDTIIGDPDVMHKPEEFARGDD